MNINLIFKPKKVLDFGEVKLHLEGASCLLEPYIEEPLYFGAKDDKELLRNRIEYVRRMICCSVKKIENLSIDGNPWDVKFIDETNTEITEESYHVLIKLFEVYLHKDWIEPVVAFYNSNKINPDALVEVQKEDKKKASKSKKK